jgi:MoxR-like ATPase
LADEINRAPAKVQSALLEAMGEQQVSVGNKTYALPDLFLVMATQNSLEQEGTYPLPEAQLDRFLMHINVDYPDAQSEAAILQLIRSENTQGNTQDNAPPTAISQRDLMLARQAVSRVHTAESLDNYIVQLTMATRKPESIDEELGQWIEYGVSPRATISLDRCSKAHAFINGNDYVTPDDIHAVIYDVFRHRLLLSFEAEAQGITKDQVIRRVLEKVSIA